MHSKIHADQYRIANTAELYQAYNTWVAEQYDGEPADAIPNMPEIYGPCTVNFYRDTATCTDTVFITD